MPRQQHPSFVFDKGLCIHRCLAPLFGGAARPVDCFLVIGRLEDATPFFLRYMGQHTTWLSEANLDDGLRKKILAGLREQVRFATQLPAYLVEHNLTAMDAVDVQAGHLAAGALEADFVRDVWRDEYLDDRDADYVILSVPFAEKDQAKALGAVWYAPDKAWRVNAKKQDTQPFERWLPTVPRKPSAGP